MITYRFKTYRIDCNYSKRKIVQERLRVEEKLYKVSCTDLAKGIYQVVYKVLILGVQDQRLKENLKRVAWGLDVGQEDRTRINHLYLRLIYFL